MNYELYHELSEYLSRFGISELRTIGQWVGVNRPTLKAKKDLFDEIIKILCGEVQPTPPSGRGAPIKKKSLNPNVLQDLKEIVNQYEPYHKQEAEEQANKTEVRDIEDADQLTENTYADEQTSGILEVTEDGGYLRKKDLRRREADVFVSQSLMRRYGLREGDFVVGFVQTNRSGMPEMTEVVSASGMFAEELETRRELESGQRAHPREQILLGERAHALWPIDIFSPMGKGQRVLIKGEAQTGKTALLAMMAGALQDTPYRLMVALLNARPEEASELRVQLRGCELYYTEMQEEAKEHLRLLRLLLARAKRLAEEGEDVVILADSLPSIAAGLTLSNSEDRQQTVMASIRNFFLSAGAFREGGSLTIVATAKTNVKNHSEESLLREFEQAENCVIVLSDQLAQAGCYPAFDCRYMQTRHAELMQSEELLQLARRVRSTLQTDHQIKMLLDQMRNASQFEALRSCLEAWK